MKSYFILGIVLLSLIHSYAHAEGFDFDNPNLDKPEKNKNAKKNANDVSLGSFGGLNFGVLFDERYMVNGGNAPGTIIHVNELNITGNIGDNISILAEQLLPTSRLSGSEDQIGDDHGFVYAIFSNIPLLPAGTAFKLGRFRFKWGIDAVLDAPANPIYPLTRKNLGFITDKGLELSGFFGNIDYTLGLADGPEHVEVEVKDSTGNSIGVVDKSVQNNSLPLILRLSSKFSSSKIGVSYFDGRSWAYTNFMNRMPNVSFKTRHAGGMADRSILYYRQHGALDYLTKWDKFDLALEYSRGRDRDPMMNTRYKTSGYFSRLDYTIKPQSLSLQLQYDQYDDGRPGIKDEKSLSTGLQIYIHDQAFIRIGYMYNRLGLSSRDAGGMIENIGFTQFYLPL
jgi:hypothetical protein